MKEPGSLGGRDDVVRPGELPDLDRWQPLDTMYLEGEDIGEPGRFPTTGTFVNARVLSTGEEQYVAVTAGLDRMLVEKMDETGEPLTGLTVDVDTAEKAGSEETSPWRYTASIVPTEQVGPPE